ncbi:hypothetical protein FBU30_005675 [Linnemannia zychae]|nr:hypothetical protein FBU30_005675 [Linnemannia zychae]
MAIPTVLVHKHRTLRAKKACERLSSQEVFFPPPPSSITSASSYASFISDLVSAFNALSTPSASSTNSPILHASFQGADHEALVDSKEKKKVIKALQNAKPEQVNEIISLLKAMPDPTKLGDTNGKDMSKPKDDTLVWTKSKLMTERNKDKENRLRDDEDEKLGDDWDKVEKKWAWGTQKSNDQLTGMIDPESCKGTTGSIIASAGSWLFSSTPTPAPEPTKESMKKTLKAKSSKILPSTNDATKNKKHGSTKRSASTLSLITGEQIAQAAAHLLTTVAASSPKEHSKQKVIRAQSSMPNIKTATLKRILTTTKASSTTSHSDTSNNLKKTKTKSDSTSLVSPTSSPQNNISSALISLARQWLTPNTSPPSKHSMSAYTYWWGFEIYVPHTCMEQIERVSNTSLVFFGFLMGVVSTIPALASLVPIAKIIATWVGYQWAVIKSHDIGKGIVISATWVLPVALASRPWDYCGKDEDNLFILPELINTMPMPKKTLKSKLSFIKP